MSLDRRSFIRCASLAAAGNAAGLRPFGALNALAQTSPSSPSYQALVCIFLFGGNDSNNTLVPYDAPANGKYGGYTAYSAIRGPLAIPASSLLTLGSHANSNYGLHPSLPNTQALFNSNNLAFVANVGTLLTPTTVANYQNATVQLPTNLFSHPDQQLEWQNAAPSGSTSTGWAGRIADSMAADDKGSQIPFVTSVFGDTLFCNGLHSSPVAVDPGNLQSGACSESVANCRTRSETAQLLLGYNDGLALAKADSAIATHANQYMAALADAVQTTKPLTTPFPAGNYLAAQLQQIAQIINVRSTLKLTRQIFFAGLGNFDTHSGQLPLQASLLSQLDGAIGSFYTATQEMGLADQITTFTMSDFSRAMQPNSNSGSDHAWGGHHFVMGGAVKGGQIYGAYPQLVLGGKNDSGVNGRWLPAVSSSQYAATLATWFGVPGGSLDTVFPSLSSFQTSTFGTNLGFI